MFAEPHMTATSTRQIPSARTALVLPRMKRCSTHNIVVQSAFRAVLYNDLGIRDTLILHALGVKWDRSLPDVADGRHKAVQSGWLSTKSL